MWAFNAESFGLTVDAFAGGPLAIDHLLERAGAVQRDTSEATGFGVDIFDTALAFGKLSMIAGLAGWFGMQQGTAIALGQVAGGVLKLVGRLHTQTFGAQGNAIRIPPVGGVAVLIERNSSDAVVA